MKTQKFGVTLNKDSCFGYKEHGITLNNVSPSALFVMCEM